MPRAKLRPKLVIPRHSAGTLQGEAFVLRELSSELDEIQAGNTKENTADVVQQPAPLLNLPANVRDKIWQLYLGQGRLSITKECHYESDLARTCRQIRSEASAIDFHKNTYEIIIDYMEFAPQPNHWLGTKVSHANVRLLIIDDLISGQYMWSNLKEWLQQFHSGQAPGIRKLYSHYGRDVEEMFNVVKELQDEPWSTVETALEAYKRKQRRHLAGDPRPFFD